MANQSFKATALTPLSTLSGIVVPINAQPFMDANANCLDGVTYPNGFSNGGGNLIIYADATKATRYPIHVIDFVTGVTPSVLVWVRLPSVAAAESIHIEADDVQTTQPIPSAAFGQYATYQDLVGVNHGRSYENAVDGSLFTEYASPSPSRKDLIFGGGYEFSGSNMLLAGVTGTGSTFPVTVSGWQMIETGATSQDPIGGISIARNTGNGGRDVTIQGRQSSTPTCFGIARYPANKTVTSNSGQVLGAMYDDPVYTSFSVDAAGNYVIFTINDIGESTVSGVIGDEEDITYDTIGMGGRADSSESPVAGGITEVRGAFLFRSEDYSRYEYLSQSDPDNFWTASDFVPGGGASVIIPSIINSYRQRRIY